MIFVKYFAQVLAEYPSMNDSSDNSNNNTICDMAVELLLKKIESKFFSLRQKISLRTELVKRNSVKKIN